MVYSVEIVCRSQSDVGLFVGSCIHLITKLVYLLGSNWVEQNTLETCRLFSLEVKIPSLSIQICFH